MGSVEFGVQVRLIGASWEEIRAVAQAVDAGPWRSLWTGDHLVATLGDMRAACFEAWSVLAGLAAVTERVRLGVLVSSNTFRNPALLAKMAVTVDHMSGGRLELGIGAGYHRREHEAYGLEFPPGVGRFDMLDEACEVIHRLLTEEGPIDYRGRHYRLEAAPFAPRCVQQPRAPIVVAGGGERRTFRTLARFGDVMNVVASTPAELRRKIAVLEERCAEVGRDPAEIRKTILTFMGVTDDAAEAARLRQCYRRFVRTEEAERALPIGTAAEVAEKLRAFAEAGAEEIIVTDLPNRVEVYEQIAAEVLGRVG